MAPAGTRYYLPMGDLISLINHFLIAMPNLGDPNFSRTVTLICEHSDQGALGIIINRPMDLSLRDVLAQMNIDPHDSVPLDIPVHLGGPVNTKQGFMLHEPLGHWQSTLPISATLGVSTSRDILEAVAQNRGPDRYFLALGYAGWAPGQLEQEIADNAWLSGPAYNKILFSTPASGRWRAAAGLLGVDLTTLSGETGHA